MQFLTDGGGDGAPTEMIAAVEIGLRNTALYHTKPMGKFAMTSAENWKDPNLKWRKRESFVTASKKIMNAESLNRWNNETLSNFQLRQVLCKTFEQRHLPLSNASAEDRLKPWIKNPRDWYPLLSNMFSNRP